MVGVDGGSGDGDRPGVVQPGVPEVDAAAVAADRSQTRSNYISPAGFEERKQSEMRDAHQVRSRASSGLQDTKPTVDDCGAARTCRHSTGAEASAETDRVSQMQQVPSFDPVASKEPAQRPSKSGQCTELNRERRGVCAHRRG